MGFKIKTRELQMKKTPAAIFFGSILIFNYCFAATNNNSNQDVHDKYCGWMDQHTQGHGNTSRHVHEQAPKRGGFQNEEPPTTSKSETCGDTTYHTNDSAPKRKGFSN